MRLRNRRPRRPFLVCALSGLALLLSLAPAVAGLQGELIIFHAGSLSIPFRQISRAFMAANPGVRISREAAGSRTSARKITDLGRPCDVMASADASVIDQLLIPGFADWNISFATNEMAIMYRPDSAFADEINGRNWPEILLRKGVRYGHSDPNADPCGYRSQFTWQLAEKYYRIPGLYRKLRQNCPPRNIRPKETDLIALLESGELDYLFIYRSICEQHHMPCVVLPDEINLKSAALARYYSQASLRISGRSPGRFITKTGRPMVYGITVLKNAPNRKVAEAFVEFVIGPEGQKIMRASGQPPLVPPRATGKVELMGPSLAALVGR
ncbi:MAG TPA: tungstate ABC transporter substrate-binding protein WtpA [Desulfobulbus sp.]|nr:tungstate ABC transporter substrate-binding protein WtpA [Desulfobulbus sp.]